MTVQNNNISFTWKVDVAALVKEEVVGVIFGLNTA